MSYIVYKHTAPNNKVYIGITCRNEEIRWNKGKGYKNNKHFYSDIQKYGWDNIEHKILFTNLSKEEACKKEIELIKKYDSTNKEKGYNRSTGGTTSSHFKHTEEAKQKMRKHRKNISSWNKNIPTSQKTKNKIMLAHKERKKVLCVETLTIYNSIREASRKNNIDKKNISYCCRKIKNYKTAGGYHWKFAKEVI